MKIIYSVSIIALLSFNVFGQLKLKLVKDLYRGSFGSLNHTYGYDTRLCVVNGTLFMVADEGKYGEEIYTYNPDNDSISLVKDIRSHTGSGQIFQLRSFNNKLIFAIDDNINDLELWVSDGTNQGTFLLKDINPQNSGVYEYASRYALSPTGIYFTGIGTTEGEELWITDGTIAGTKIVKDLRAGSQGSYPSSLFYHPILNLLFFRANNGTGGSEPYLSDGTIAGTKILKDIVSGGDSNPFSFTAFNNKVIFTVYTGFDNTNGKSKYETYISDGTPMGTSSIHSVSVKTGEPKISNYTTLGNRCIFSSFNSLYSTDGTTMGTILITDKLKITEDNEFTVFNNKILFTATDSLHGEELFITDGTNSGTQLLKDVNPGKLDGGIYNFTLFRNKLYFIATTTLEGRQVWETDGTTAGTILSFRVNPNESSYISNLTVLGKALYFIGNDGITGSELWKYYEETTTSKNASIQSEITLYPNPNFGKITILAEEIISDIEIIDIYGKSFCYLNENKKVVNLNLNVLPGTYFMRLKLKSNKIVTTKFLVSN